MTKFCTSILLLKIAWSHHNRGSAPYSMPLDNVICGQCLSLKFELIKDFLRVKKKLSLPRPITVSRRKEMLTSSEEEVRGPLLKTFLQLSQRTPFWIWGLILVPANSWRSISVSWHDHHLPVLALQAFRCLFPYSFFRPQQEKHLYQNHVTCHLCHGFSLHLFSLAT